jgi:hypothetical protein
MYHEIIFDQLEEIIRFLNWHKIGRKEHFNPLILNIKNKLI